MRHSFSVCVGPRTFRIGSDWRAPIAQMERLYKAYPKADDAIPDFTVRLEATSLLRRYIRPQVAIEGDYMLPEAVPLPLQQGLLAAEMAMNLQVALGERKLMLLHASSVERDGKALIMTGESGSGKSTLSALLGERGWRFMGDEFALLDPETGMLWPYPRPVSLKNAAIEIMRNEAGEDRFGPLMKGTPKGDIRHFIPDETAIVAMNQPAKPALILFPRFGGKRAIREMGQGEVFVRLTQASTNYVALGETGFDALTGLVKAVPTRAIDFDSTAVGVALVDELWSAFA